MIPLKYNPDFYVLSGGPGVGKTTVLDELKLRGFQIVPEIARQLIKEQEQVHGDALPWKNQELYKDEMFSRSVASYEHEFQNHKLNKKPLFFDRGFLDTLCYAKLIDSEITAEMQNYAERWHYNKNVFLCPPWQEIYKTDSERKQDWLDVVLHIIPWSIPIRNTIITLLKCLKQQLKNVPILFKIL